MRRRRKPGLRPPGSIRPGGTGVRDCGAGDHRARTGVRESACNRPGKRVAGRQGVRFGLRLTGPRRPGGIGTGRGHVLRSRLRSQGFTLLETMVALVIFTGAAMALYALFNTNLIALTRAHDVSRQTPAVRHAVEHLASINPREAGDGRIELDGLDVVWSATLVQPPRQSQTLTGGRGYYEIGLYEIEFAMSDRGRPLGTWRMRSVGYEKVREPEL